MRFWRRRERPILTHPCAEALAAAVAAADVRLDEPVDLANPVWGPDTYRCWAVCSNVEAQRIVDGLRLSGFHAEWSDLAGVVDLRCSP